MTMNNDMLVEAVARKLAGQSMIDDGYGEDSRLNAERGEMWRNFKDSASVAIETISNAAGAVRRTV